MKLKIPENSILGFQILNTKQSIYSSYFLILFTYTLNSQFGISRKELIATYLFNLISNLSLIILLANSIIRRKGISKKIQIFIIPLLLHLPLSLIIAFSSLFKLSNLLL